MTSKRAQVIWFFLLGFISLTGHQWVLAQTTEVKINVEKEGEVISKYIYGQFIEHLGKSVYSGLWAEMILDRKFYYPITDTYDPWGEGQPDSWWGGSVFPYLKASPWKVIGASGTVVMDSISPFVGKYAAEIKPVNSQKAGIVHQGISLVNNRAYQGYIVLKGDSAVFPVSVRIFSQSGEIYTLQLADADTIYTKHSFTFTSDQSTDSAFFEISSAGSGAVEVGIVSLMPADNIDGWRADIVALLKQLDATIYRWPGGNFVSGYNWRNGIGDRDKRAPEKNPDWTGIEPNDVGIHEFMNLVKMLGSEPFVALNMGLGSVEEAAAEVEYFNGDTNTVEGKSRKLNGQAEPFTVKYWAVGNEMFGTWQLGYMPLADYEQKHNAAAQAIWQVDPSAQLVAVGDVSSNWSKPMLTECGDFMNLISEHKYCKENTNTVSHINALATEVKNLATAYRTYRKNDAGLAEKDIRIAFDEYNYWYGENPYGQLGIRFHQKDALGVAAALHEIYKNSDLFFMANYAQTVNVLGCIKATDTDASFEATALPLMLYRKQYGNIPVEITGSTLKLNVAAAFAPGKDTISISIINAQDKEVYCKPVLSGAVQKGGFKKWTLANSDPNAYNEPGKEPVIKIEEESSDQVIDSVLIPAYGLILMKYKIELKPTGILNHNSDMNLNIYPNPVNETMRVYTTLTEDTNLSIKLMNMTGQVIANLYNGNPGIGVFEQAFNLSGIAGGTYLCQFNIGDQHYTKILTHLSSKN
jgi:alpha-L-arabinofuranosidase